MSALVICAALAGAGAIAASVIVGGRYCWNAGTKRLRGAIDAGRLPLRSGPVDFGQLERLPAPVQRYLRRVLSDGGGMVAQVQVHHRGSMKMSDKPSSTWKAFCSDQHIVTMRPGFDWSARIDMLPGIPVLVHDAYIGGEGRLHAALFGLLSVAKLHGTDDIAQGELMRFLAEAVWYPTLFLPGHGGSWEAIDGRHARATLIDASVSASLVFTFDDDGLVSGVRAEARGRAVGGKTVPTPWQGRFWHYRQMGGMLVPLEGEVGWVLPEGLQPYWRGEITSLVHAFDEM